MLFLFITNWHFLALFSNQDKNPRKSETFHWFYANEFGFIVAIC